MKIKPIETRAILDVKSSFKEQFITRCLSEKVNGGAGVLLTKDDNSNKYRIQEVRSWHVFDITWSHNDRIMSS